jgi:hypothetical protein
MASEIAVCESQQSDWVELYRAAVEEFDAARLRQRIEQADLAIKRRVQELASSSNHHAEWMQLQDALRMLRILRQELE